MSHDHRPLTERINDWAAGLPIGWRLAWYGVVLAAAVGFVWGFWAAFPP